VGGLVGCKDPRLCRRQSFINDRKTTSKLNNDILTNAEVKMGRLVYKWNLYLPVEKGLSNGPRSPSVTFPEECRKEIVGQLFMTPAQITM
jgi:hypothetical protein